MPVIRNEAHLASTPARKDALAVIRAGWDAIATAPVVARSVSLDGEDVLHISGHRIPLRPYRRICLIGFGKAACAASEELKRILGGRVTPEAVIRSSGAACAHPEHLSGTHPLPSAQNVEHTRKLLGTCADLTGEDLVLVVISGGGSAMLCGSPSECDQGQRLYRDALRSGMTIHELNTVRKHISELKGGGLAKSLYPARVIGLIFSDVPGTSYDMVASGPTWPDVTDAADARAVLDRYGLSGYELTETPKEGTWFTNVTNIVLASNRIALEAMAQKANELGYPASILSDSVYEEPAQAVDHMRGVSARAVVAGGEFRIVVPDGGKGGRNTRATLTALERIGNEELFIAFASDGLDNTDAAGAIADAVTREHARAAGLDAAAYLKDYNDYAFFEKSGDLIFTGPTDANVSDLMLLLKE
ncbi:MAG TPA: DUF4147 domain-containing protein [Candidatus Paceibacterota bacterium]|nr:DUF4147 domain-containing protein [Candidatus Paceibacterota bacterium]